MARLVLLLLFLAGGFALLNGIGVELPGRHPSFGTSLEGRSLRLAGKDIEARYDRREAIVASYMLFGGDAEQRTNALSHATLATLPILEARRIHRRHPDFHLCKSPGAKLAMQLTETTSFVALNPAARDGLVEALELHERRVRKGGERTCLRVSGANLELESIRLAADGSDVTQEFASALGQSRFLLAEQVELADCEGLLR